MSDELQHGINHTIYEALVSQQEVNRALSEGFRAMSLQSDKYDAEIQELRDEVAALGMEKRRLFELHAHVMCLLVRNGIKDDTPTDAASPGYSVRVNPFRCVPDESAGLRDND